MFDYQAAVIGAGPAGASAAKALVKKGIKTVIIEKKALPRDKPCSGLIIPKSVQLVKEIFGEPPADVFSKPDNYTGMIFYFRSGRKFEMPFEEATWNVNRKHFDKWLCEKSEAMIIDATKLESFTEDTEGVTLYCKGKEKELIKIRCQVAISAEGAQSSVARKLDINGYDGLKWFLALQSIYRCRIDLEPGEFHFFTDPSISLYSVAYVKDDLLYMDVNINSGENGLPIIENFKQYLIDQFGFEEYELVSRRGCRSSWGAVQGWYNFGTERMLIAGEASGLFNMFGEGISSALSTGNIAGQVAAKCIKEEKTPGEMYRSEVEKERLYTLEQFEGGIKNLFEFNKFLRDKSLIQRFLVMKDLFLWASRRGGLKKRITPN